VLLAIVILLVVVAVSLLPHVIRSRQLARRMQRENPEWAAAWKRASRSRKRRIRHAMRHGNTLYDADDARLLVGLSRRADMYQETVGRRLRYSLPLAAVVLVVGIAAGDPVLAVQAVVLFGLALQRERRHRTAAANRQIHGNP
jgi:hypothetical protein